MKRRPRDRNEPLFSRRHVFYSVLQGLVVLAVPFLQQVFRFAPLSLLDVAMCLGAGALSVLGFELVKFRPRKNGVVNTENAAN